MITRRPAPRKPRRLASMVGSSAPAAAAPAPPPKPEPDALDERADQGADDAPRKRKSKPAEQGGKTE